MRKLLIGLLVAIGACTTRTTTIPATTNSAPPSGADRRRPQGWFFSKAMTSPSSSIQPRLPVPTTNISNINAQQQPTQ